MKDAYYFSHDSNARNDQKIIRLRAKYGMQGYGIYWGIIEMLREADNYELDLDFNTISFDLRENKEVTKSVIEDFDLFFTNKDIFYSISLKNRMIKLDEIKEKRAKAGQIGGKISKKQAKNKQTLNKNKQVKYSIVNKSIVNNSKVDNSTLFINSKFFNFKLFEKQFKGTKYEIYNLGYYHEKISNWSAAKSEKRIDWIATARNFMLGDHAKNKPILKEGTKIEPESKHEKNTREMNEITEKLIKELGDE